MMMIMMMWSLGGYWLLTALWAIWSSKVYAGYDSQSWWVSVTQAFVQLSYISTVPLVA